MIASIHVLSRLPFINYPVIWLNITCSTGSVVMWMTM